MRLHTGLYSNIFLKWQRTHAIPNSLPGSVVFIKQHENIMLVACVLNARELFLHKFLIYRDILLVRRIEYDKTDWWLQSFCQSSLKQTFCAYNAYRFVPFSWKGGGLLCLFYVSNIGNQSTFTNSNAEYLVKYLFRIPSLLCVTVKQMLRSS
jgi:hypothetical protein